MNGNIVFGRSYCVAETQHCMFRFHKRSEVLECQSTYSVSINNLKGQATRCKATRLFVNMLLRTHSYLLDGPVRDSPRTSVFLSGFLWIPSLPPSKYRKIT